MICPACSCENSAPQIRCGKCRAVLPRLAVSLSANHAAKLAPSVNDHAAAIAAAEFRLAELTTRISAVEAERDCIVAALDRARRALDLSEPTAGDVQSEPLAPQILDVGNYRITLGEPHGTRVEPANIRPIGVERRRRDRRLAAAFPSDDMRGAERAAVWALLAAGARVVRVVGAAGAGATLLLMRLAADARDRGFADGALYMTHVRGPALDIGQRLAREFYAERLPRYEFAAELQRLFSGVAALVLLDRAEIDADEQAELTTIFPSLRFVIVDPLAMATTPACVLGPLDADRTLAMLEAGSGRPLERGREIARVLAGSDCALPGPALLAGIAVVKLGGSFSAGGPQPTAEAAIANLIAWLAPAERSLLATIACAPTILTAERLAHVERRDVKRELDVLVTCGLLVADAGVYIVPAYVAPFVSRVADAAAEFERVLDVSRAAIDPTAPTALTDAQLASVERMVQRAFDRAHWGAVLALGPALARRFAACGTLGAWGRVLNLVAAAAKRAGNTTVLNATRHELGVRSLVLRENRKAETLLALAARDRSSAGDRAGSAVSLNALALVEPHEPAAAPTPPPAARTAYRRPRRRPRPGRSFVSLTAAVVVAAVIAVWFWTRPAPGPVIAEFSADRAWVTPGAGAHLCLRATGADLIEVAPDVGPVATTGRTCFAVRPKHTTTYAVLASGAQGEEAHRAVTVEVREDAAARPLRIQAFLARPARIGLGKSSQLCFAVSGAQRLRIVPTVGTLTRLTACHTIRPDVPRRYTYHLIAIGENGQVAIRHTQIDVEPAVPAAPVRPSVAPRTPVAVAIAPARAPAPIPTAAVTAPDGRLARRAIYQFDATPGIIERGQAASICVGIGVWARGEVNGIGALPPGITKCYRVHPYSTTVYRLHIVLDRSVAIERVTVAVRLPGRVHQVARNGPH